MILEDDEVVTERPSLGAGNDPGCVFDLETTHRVAEFKLSAEDLPELIFEEAQTPAHVLARCASDPRAGGAPSGL